MALPPPEPRWVELLRLTSAPVLALGAAYLVDRMSAARGFFPPGFARPWRRGLGLLALAFVLWAGLFGTLTNLGHETPADLSHLDWPRLFLLHGLMIGTTLVWFLAGYAGVRPAASPLPEAIAPVEPAPLTEPLPLGEGAPAELPLPPPLPVAPPPRPPLGRVLAGQLGLLTPDLGHELGVGVLVGVGSWFVVLAAAVVLALILYFVGAEGVAPKSPPEIIVWIAALPFGVRLLAALSAGVVEETFFRGFLQPRIGLWLSSAFFVLGHLSYGQPILLFGVAILSLIYGSLVRWRQTIWPAIAAHALFDGVQLLVVIPTTLKLLGKG
jgi:membrane protease YdiL (CAAX protease family)